MKHIPCMLPIALLATHTFAHGEPATRPDVTINPHPRMKYEVSVKVDGSPGPFDRIEAIADYRVKNEDCIALTPLTGATVPPEKRVPLTLLRSGNNRYTFEFFTDRIQDQDYFDRGVCQWSIVAVSANLWIENVNFSAPLFHDDIFQNHPVTRYYSNRSYATRHMDRVDVGEPNRDQYEDEANATFSITLDARKTSQ
ncbi:hypothetical protein IAE35_12785 [Pseudomonas sp. S75]|uniref:hypothetical protein n=1 Tax=unclassified Pseudomonas TaxID=196821 RepID=UPI00190367A5|nr:MULTISPECIES: hypothetical protein [unclassified Pseudomonas]MBJ9974474.1 hypothetical protein [Pseudomonas sp. S30]MBK0154217.1 hypothetical protein [Pseudomonas sp. S75]